jgi:hypothetical protein
MHESAAEEFRKNMMFKGSAAKEIYKLMYELDANQITRTNYVG